MKRASYKEAIDWLARHENPHYHCFQLVCVIFDAPREKVEDDILGRQTLLRATGELP